MMRHVGKHADRKVVVMYRQVPNEDHMCLVTYSDLLPRMLHDSIMQCLESSVGQQAENLAEALFRNKMADGRNILEVLHKEGFMKKVATNQIIMTPTPAATIRLDELNKLLSEMAQGEDAIKRMAELDAHSGLQTKKKDNTTKPVVSELPPLQAGVDDVLTDEVIAKQQLAQATRMRTEANSLLAEATRLEAEAAALSPVAATPVVTEAVPAAKVKKAATKSPKSNATKETQKAQS